MSKLILHIGSHKTGTTSLQAALRNASESLAQTGAFVLDRKTSTHGVVRTAGQGEGFVADLRRKIVDRTFQPRDGVSIYSDEGLFWLYEPEEVEQFARLLKARYDTVEIYAYLRRQDQMVLSHRKQVVFGLPAHAFYGSNFLTLPEVEPYHNRFLDFHAKLSEVWGAAFGQEALRVIPYDRQKLHNQDVVADFAHRTGLPLEPVAEDKNTALSAAQIIAGLALSDHGWPRKKLRRILAHLEDRIGQPDAKLLPSREQAMAFMAHFAGSNARLAAAFSCDGAPVTFSDDFSMYPEQEAPVWTSEQVFLLMNAASLQGREPEEEFGAELDDELID